MNQQKIMEILKGVLGWAKRQWLLVALAVVVLGAVPAMVYFSQEWGTSLVADLQKDVTNDVQEISSAKSVTYTIPSPVAGRAPIEQKFGPNEKLINEFKTRRDQQAAELSQVVKVAMDFNQSRVQVNGRDVVRVPRKYLIEGIFPQPAPQEDTLKRADFQRAYLEGSHEALLRQYKAGMPPDVATVASELSDRLVPLVQQYGGGDNGDLSKLPPEARQKVEAELLKVREHAYQSRAAQLSFYADMSIFKLPAPDASKPPDLKTCWDWQQQYWIDEDILSIAAVANAGASDQGIPGSIVKQIKSIDIGPLVRANANAPSPDAPPPADTGTVPLDYKISVTGRVSGPGSGNSFFDVRTVKLVVVVSTQKLPQLFDAIAAANFMTVIDLHLARVDLYDALTRGFYYGPEAVVQATIELETVWLRDWMTPNMPHEVRSVLGVPEPTPPADAGKSG